MTVTAEALNLHNGSWARCSCLIGSQALVADGIAKFTQLSLSTVGRFKLNLTMGRGSIQRLTQLTAAFDVKPAALVATNSSISGVYTLGDVLGSVVISVGCKK